MSGLLLGARMSPFDFQRFKIENVDFEKKIDDFKTDVSQTANIPKDSLELVYCGNILDDDMSLSDCGLKPGVMVHVLKKKAKEIPLPAQSMSEGEIQALVLAFKTLTLNPSYKNSLQKLSRPDILENIIMITPGLSQDPVAISMIQDPELLVRMGDIDTVRRIVELHPTLAVAAHHIAAAVHEEGLSNSTNQPSTSSGFGHLLDMFSDDDDIESSQSSDSMPRTTSQDGNFPGITTALLAAALASASQGNNGSGSSAPGEGASAITPEMVSAAMQRAMANVSAPSPTTPTSSAPSASPPENPSSEGGGNSDNLVEQMRQMRELGLTDDALNLQALQLAGGNVHAAVDLVFSGAISHQ